MAKLRKSPHTCNTSRIARAFLQLYSNSACRGLVCVHLQYQLIFAIFAAIYIPAIVDMYSKLRNIENAAVAMILLVAAMLCGCSGNDDKLNAQIRNIVEHAELQNEQGIFSLTEIILSDSARYRAYLTKGGGLDIYKLQKAVDAVGKKADATFRWDVSAYGAIPTKDLQLNLFLERSGSMTGYDARSTSGDFKRTLNELITRFPRVGGTTGKIFIVNDAVYPHKGSFEQFVQQKDIFAATAGIGDPSYTDFATIFDYVLRDDVAEDINILVTDMIYSPRGTAGVTPAKIFNEEQSLATSIFQKHADKSVIVVKLSSDFDGQYYPYNTPQAGVSYQGYRPFYVVITGSSAALYKLRRDPRYASFLDFATLPGYQAHYVFSRKPQVPDYYTILPRSKGSVGSFSLSGSNSSGNGVHALKDLKSGKGGKIRFALAVNLMHVAVDADYLLDEANYTIKSDGVAELIKVERITSEMVDARNRRYLSDASHLLTIEIDAGNVGKDLEVSLINRMPRWFAESTDNDDSRRGSRFATTTFGLNNFLEGIYRAYHGTAVQPSLTQFSIKLEQ